MKVQIKVFPIIKASTTSGETVADRVVLEETIEDLDVTALALYLNEKK